MTKVRAPTLRSQTITIYNATHYETLKYCWLQCVPLPGPIEHPQLPPTSCQALLCIPKLIKLCRAPITQIQSDAVVWGPRRYNLKGCFKTPMALPLEDKVASGTPCNVSLGRSGAAFKHHDFCSPHCGCTATSFTQV